MALKSKTDMKPTVRQQTCQPNLQLPEYVDNMKLMFSKIPKIEITSS